jgi:hypothetical protein
MLSETNSDLLPTPAAAFNVFSFQTDIAPSLLSCSSGASAGAIFTVAFVLYRPSAGFQSLLHPSSPDTKARSAPYADVENEEREDYFCSSFVTSWLIF